MSYTCTFYNFEIISQWWRCGFWILNKFESLLPKNALIVPNLIEITPVVLEKIFKAFMYRYMYFHLFVIISPWKGGCLILIPSIKVCFPSLVEIGTVALKISCHAYLLFWIISLWKKGLKAWPLIWTNFYPLYQRMLSIKFSCYQTTKCDQVSWKAVFNY